MIDNRSYAHNLIKVAEHSFQVPMANNTPLVLNYLCFGARFWKSLYRDLYRTDHMKINLRGRQAT